MKYACASMDMANDCLERLYGRLVIDEMEGPPSDEPRAFITPEALAERFHNTCERLAPEHGRNWIPNPWDGASEGHRGLMVATAREVLEWLYTERRADHEGES
jgi:hypothetical protein